MTNVREIIFGIGLIQTPITFDSLFYLQWAKVERDCEDFDGAILRCTKDSSTAPMKLSIDFIGVPSASTISALIKAKDALVCTIFDNDYDVSIDFSPVQTSWQASCKIDDSLDLVKKIQSQGLKVTLRKDGDSGVIASVVGNIGADKASVGKFFDTCIALSNK